MKDYFWLACRFVESISKADASPEAVSEPVREKSINLVSDQV